MSLSKTPAAPETSGPPLSDEELTHSSTPNLPRPLTLGSLQEGGLPPGGPAPDGGPQQDAAVEGRGGTLLIEDTFGWEGPPQGACPGPLTITPR